MDEGVAAELRALRVRAYAPGGDIADDPAALARLAELEAREREDRMPHARAPEPDSEPVRPPIIDGIPDLATPRSDDPRADESQTDESRDDDAGPTAPRARRLRPLLIWAGSLVAVAVVSVGITAFATARSASTATALPPDAGVSHVTTLLPTGEEIPDFMRPYGDGVEAGSFEKFLGLSVFRTTDIWRGGDNICLSVARIDDDQGDGSVTGSSYQGCSAGAFPAAVSFIVWDDQPEELLERYPVGTALQFVLTDAGVDVFVSEAPTSSAAPEAPGEAGIQPAG
ncbi:hypothetical protein O1W71_12730 [Microbacterium sp. H37-C3]|uniref:hypothetical protein n=1 Tax=Microbacterium sp. H37-C3 TaxID=3004354 RepID=UPI0022AEF887|nr:hypothetical protein [Microbacterium sp. H37-C3]MCZ4068538.1 hypothetical protein [Microbacterium sp. H37-C3]